MSCLTQFDCGKILTTLIGSFAGFFFGLVLFILRDWFLGVEKKKAAKLTLIFLVEELASKLELDPGLFEHLSLNSLTGSLQGIVNDKSLDPLFREFLTYYTHWKTGWYLNIRQQLVDSDREILKEISGKMNLIKY